MGLCVAVAVVVAAVVVSISLFGYAFCPLVLNAVASTIAGPSMHIFRGPSLTPSPERERLVDEPTGDVVDHIVSQHFGEPPVETEALQLLHDVLRAHLRAARVPATRGPAIFVVAAPTAPVVKIHPALPTAVAVVTGAPDTAPVVGSLP